ncbi:cyclin-e binding protein 1-like protein [Leishmania tarentolae]|uniref:Cyclin-e binding protein 1-like protein n=1 Tax=Leishmania tarentolae TaxID=5689 RepID=A0A640L0L0_LEITA|nr:cyclin-e binding protein 1-like protein [Leishmania tarentolae]
MLAVVPTTAAPPTEAALHSLADSAKSVVAALRPFLETSLSPVASPNPLYTIKKVASCKAVYSALLRSDGVLLLLSHPAADGAACSAHVSVLESGGEAVADVAAGESHIVYCTVSGAVYSCGYDNTYGQLGDGTVWSSNNAADGLAEKKNAGGVRAPVLSVPRRIAGFGEVALTDGTHRDRVSDEDTDESLNGLKDYRIAIGLAPLPSSLASCTRSSAAAAKSTSTDDSAASWRHVPPPADRHIRQVACGAHHTLMLTKSGCCVYACGTGAHGQLGGSRPVLLQPTFRAITLLFGIDMAQVAAAGAHSFVLLRNGLLYAFGDNTCGQLGLGHTKRVNRPTTVPLTDKEKYEAFMAQDHAAATTKGHRQLDAKTYATLRAPYASTESTYYPLRVPRLKDNGKPHTITTDEDPNSGAAFTAALEYGAQCHEIEDSNSRFRVVHVYCCVSWTLLETTNPDIWLSCGAPLTRGVNQANVATTTARIDGCGVLGRPLLHHKTEAYVFQPVNWAATLSRMRRNVDAATAAGAVPSAWVGNQQNVFSACPSDDAREDTSDQLQLRGVQTKRCTPFSISSEGNSSLRTPIVTTAPAAGHCSTFDNRISDGTLPVFSHSNNNIEKAIFRSNNTLVSASPTSLLMAFSSASAGDVDHVDIVTSMLIQSGSPAVVALEVQADSSADVHMVKGSPAHAGMDGPLPVDSSGTSVLQVNSTQGAVIPLPSYVLVM